MRLHHRKDQHRQPGGQRDADGGRDFGFAQSRAGQRGGADARDDQHEAEAEPRQLVQQGGQIIHS
jgi:hypothetical protein